MPSVPLHFPAHLATFFFLTSPFSGPSLNPAPLSLLQSLWKAMEAVAGAVPKDDHPLSVRGARP